jgi:xanthine dehydrogenase accessory factor
MFDEFLTKMAESRSRGEAFATALVVRYESPVSGKPGDKAIIYGDGRIWGWIGGGCAQPTVIKEALKALQDGSPRLLRISPSPNPESEEGVVDYTMTCHSGGSLDIFIEPVLPKPRIVIFGRSVVAQALARLGQAIHYDVTNGTNAAPRPQTFVVVATQGEADEEALEQALTMDARYIAFVASKVKAGKIFDFLREKGISSELLEKVRAPAGLQIGAVSPEEIAVSILAEIVQASRRMPQSITVQPAKPEAKDPICGMTVNPERARYKSERDGTTFYFCCAGCKQAFDAAAERSAPALNEPAHAGSPQEMQQDQESADQAHAAEDVYHRE